METKDTETPYSTTVYISIGIITLLSILVFAHYFQIKDRKGTIVLPAGGTYLGPTDTPVPTFTGIIKGSKYPYSFTVPQNIKLVSLGSVYDIYALDIAGQNPSNNVLIGVDDITKNKIALNDYIQNWWKQFDGLKGVELMTPLTNSNNLKGFKVKFLGGSNQDVFLASPNGAHIIHLANGPLEKSVFDSIVDSVAWNEK